MTDTGITSDTGISKTGIITVAATDGTSDAATDESIASGVIATDVTSDAQALLTVVSTIEKSSTDVTVERGVVAAGNLVPVADAGDDQLILLAP